MRSSKYTSKFLYFKSNTKEAFSVVNEPQCALASSLSRPLELLGPLKKLVLSRGHVICENPV
jgi:hypothetical protein